MAAANYTKIAQHVVREDCGYTMQILCDEECAGVRVNMITMHISEEDPESNSYTGDDCDGDLAVHWVADNLQNTGSSIGSLLMRGQEDEVGQVMRQFYSDGEFTDQLQTLLMDAGFSEEAASSVCGSEWGMQDEGRASYDAYRIAAEVRAAMAQ